MTQGCRLMILCFVEVRLGTAYREVFGNASFASSLHLPGSGVNWGVMNTAGDSPVAANFISKCVVS